MHSICAVYMRFNDYYLYGFYPTCLEKLLKTLQEFCVDKTPMAYMRQFDNLILFNARM